jgi:hypothetical protein
MKKLITLFVLLTIINTAWAAKELKNSDPVYGHPNETLRMQILQTITPITATKIIFLQNNKIVSWNEVDKSYPYCSFENVRDRDKTVLKPIKKDTFYKLTDDFFTSWEKALGYRIWQKKSFFWDNGNYQAFDCKAFNTPYIFTYGELKKHIGKYVRIGK